MRLEPFTPYISRGVRISQSSHHESMFIFEFADGTFFSVASSASAITSAHPRDENQEFNREYKEFSKTSNYKPQSVGFTSFAKMARSHSKQSRS